MTYLNLVCPPRQGEQYNGNILIFNVCNAVGGCVVTISVKGRSGFQIEYPVMCVPTLHAPRSDRM